MGLLKLVIVDDEPILLEGLVKTYDWNGMGYEVVGFAQSGEQALKVIREKKPHVVLTDIRMKQISGLMVMEEIKKENPECQFVVLSAYRDFELFDTQGEKLARATSRWVLIDIVKRRPQWLTQELIEKYQGEPQSQAFEEELENMSYPKDFFDTENAVKQRYTVLRRDIDSNMHMHNLAYLDAAGELLPQQIYEEGEKNHIRISYKKEILYGEEITGVYIQHEDRHVVGFTDTNKGVRAIVELW